MASFNSCLYVYQRVRVMLNYNVVPPKRYPLVICYSLLLKMAHWNS